MLWLTYAGLNNYVNCILGVHQDSTQNDVYTFQIKWRFVYVWSSYTRVPLSKSDFWLFGAHWTSKF